jgi:hypothetical protein
MTTKDVKERLCYYDLRNPDGFIDLYDPEEDKEIGNYSKKDCSCDNCFYGRTTMAEKLLKYMPDE